MNIEKLKNLANKEKIEITNYDMQNYKARIIQDNKNSFIFMNYNQISNSIEEKCILAEELGHYYCDALYSPLYYDKEMIDKNEYRATKWAFKTLIHKKDIISLLKEEKSIYEVCEELGVTEELLEKAYNYYTSN